MKTNSKVSAKVIKKRKLRGSFTEKLPIEKDLIKIGICIFSTQGKEPKRFVKVTFIFFLIVIHINQTNNKAL